MTINNIEIQKGWIKDRALGSIKDSIGIIADIEGSESIDHLINEVVKNITTKHSVLYNDPKKSSVFKNNPRFLEYRGKLIDEENGLAAFILEDDIIRGRNSCKRQGIFGLKKDKSSKTLKSSLIAYFSHMNYEGNLNPTLFSLHKGVLSEGILEYHFHLMGGSHKEFFVLDTLKNLGTWKSLKTPLNIYPYTLYG